MNRNVISVNEKINWPRGFTLIDNRIQDELQRHLSPSAFCVWFQYLRFWGSDKKKAYPSLSYLSRVTGLAERTLRKCNNELVNKKFLKKKSGSSNSSNVYYYVPIEKILKYYEDGTEPEATEKSVSEKVTNIIDVPTLINDIPESNKLSATMFIQDFIKGHGEYVPDDRDIEALKENISIISSSLLEVFFKTKNQYIANSDRSMYFYFRPKTQQVLKAEFLKTDIGRWTAQAEKQWDNIKHLVESEVQFSKGWTQVNDEDRSIKTFIETHVKFNRGNSTRDKFVHDYLVRKIKLLSKDN
jgi:hypothetical protein